MTQKVVVTGSLAYDHIMSMPTRFKDHIMPDKIHTLNISFIMDTFRKEFGGTGGNISYSLSLLNIASTLVGIAGKDFAPYKRHLNKKALIDVKYILVNRKTLTAQGFATTDADDNQIWGFYEGAMKFSDALSLPPISKNDYLVVSPNKADITMKFVRQAIRSKTPYLFDPAFNIPHFSLPDLKLAISNCDILVGNDYEIELIARRLKITRAKLAKKVNILITTFGSKGSEIIKDGKTYTVPAAKPKNTSDPTGAGDAYRAGFLAGYFRGLPLEVCGKMGALSAVYTVEAYGTQTHDYTLSEFKERYKENFKEALKLES